MKFTQQELGVIATSLQYSIQRIDEYKYHPSYESKQKQKEPLQQLLRKIADNNKKKVSR